VIQKDLSRPCQGRLGHTRAQEGLVMSIVRTRSKALSVAALAVILGTAAAGFAAPPPASAGAPPSFPPSAEPESVRSWNALRAEGNAAYKAGRVAEAVEAWTRAYAIRRSHVVACAIGRIELLARGDALEGARWLTRCASQAPLPEPNQPKELTSQKEEIELRNLARSRVGAVRVVTDPGAMVEVDGREAGKAPLDEEVFVMPGAHRFAVTLGERSRLVEVTLAAGESRTVELSLRAAPLPELSAARPLQQVNSPGGAQDGSLNASNGALLGAGMAVGGAGLAMTIGFGVVAIKVRSDEKEAVDAVKGKPNALACSVLGRPGCADVKGLSDMGDAFTAVSLIGVSAAVAGGLMTAYAIFNPRRKASEPGIQAAFVGTPGGGGFVLRGGF